VGLTAGVLLPTLVFVVALLSLLSGREHAEAERRLGYRARVLGEMLDGEVLATQRALDALASSPSLDDPPDLAAFHTTARRVRATQPSWVEVILFDAERRPRVNTGFRWGDGLPPVVESDSLTRAIAMRRPESGDLGRGVMGRWAVPIRVPVFRGGALRYVLTAVVRPDAFERVVSIGGRNVDGSFRVLLDRRGRLVARTDAAGRAGAAADPLLLRRIAAAPEGRYLGPHEGVESYVGFRRAPVTGWEVAVVVPRAAVDGPVRRARAPLLAIGVALLVVSAAGAFVLGRRLARAIASAADGADALARGLDPSVIRSPIRELARLGESLERSSALLRARERERDELFKRTEAARAEAADASRAKDEFLAMLGHELRNPLAPIATALHLMRTRGGGDGRERAVIERQVQHLSRLVDDLLDVSRLTAGRVTLELRLVALDEVVARAVETAGPLLEQRRHRLTVDVPPGLVVRGDATRLTQVVANLLTNAAKYTDPDGDLRVRAAREGDSVVLRVSDNGMGIGPALLPRVFDSFAQAHQAVDRAHGGLGLGLAIVRSLVALHGGAVEARSDGDGRGSEFIVRLPAADAAGEAEAPAEAAARDAPPPGARRGAVLLVDDNTDALEMMELALQESGFDVRTAADGADALAAVESFAPDVAVLDIGLPVMDGYELARALRRRPGLAGLPLVALTGYGLPSDRARSAEAGFDEHLVKPVELAVIEATILALIARAATTGRPPR
jgi:signal transduction histidine kinase/CheY-like chemotaxis protein